MSRFEVHAHTHYSNLRLLDCINRPKDLIKRAIELGLKGISITDHECVSSHMEINLFAKEIQKENPDFKIGYGNEIYLCADRELGQKYYHFILIAKTKEGHKALRELSSMAWMNSYWDRGMERVVTTYEELEAIVKKYPGELIATTACLGGELGTKILEREKAKVMGDVETAHAAHNHIISFLTFCRQLFGDDFYLECAPAKSEDQICVNKILANV